MTKHQDGQAAAVAIIIFTIVAWLIAIGIVSWAVIELVLWVTSK